MTYTRETFKAVCSECKKECEVPFKPDGTRPVYCRECYAKKRANSYGIGRGLNDSNSKVWQHPRKEDKFSLTSET